MTKGEGGQKSQKIDDVFYERPLDKKQFKRPRLDPILSIFYVPTLNPIFLTKLFLNDIDFLIFFILLTILLNTI